MPDERKAILEAAKCEFAEVGLKESSLTSIASRAGLETGAVQALFVDKSALLGELMEEVTDPLISGIAMAVAEIEDSKEVVRKSLYLYDAWFLDHQDIARIFMRCALDGPESMKELFQKSLLPSEFYEHLQRIVNKGQIRCKDLFVLSMLFDSLIMFPHMIRPAVELMSPEQTAEEIMESRFDAIIDLFENGLYSD